MANNTRWLDVVHTVFRDYVCLTSWSSSIMTYRRQPYWLPPVTLPLSGDVDVLAPRLTVSGMEDRARLLDMSAVA